MTATPTLSPPEAAPPPAAAADGATEGGQLPFDPITLLIGLWRRKWFALAGFAGSLALAVVLAQRLGTQIYESTTTMMFTADPRAIEAGFYKTPDLETQVAMIELESHLERIRERLELPASIGALRGAIEAWIAEDTNLVHIQGNWPEPELAASIANTTREVFLQSLVDIRSREAQRLAESLESRLEEVDRELAEADAALGDFTIEHRIVNLDQEAQWLLEEFSNVSVLLQQAKIEKETTDLQLLNLERIMREVQHKLEQEAEQNSAAMESVTIANIRAERTRERIRESQEIEINAALLAQAELEYQRKKRLFAEGLIPAAEMEDAKAAYETQVARTVYSDEVRNLKKELARLDEQIIPQNGGRTAASAPIMENFMLRSIDLELQAASLAKKVEIYEKHLERLSRKLDRLPGVTKRYISLKRRVTSAENEKSTLESRLVEVRRLAADQTPYFTTINEAEVPLTPSESNKKLIAIAVAMLGFMFSFSSVVLATVLDTTFKSQADVRTRTRLKCLGDLPRLGRKEEMFPEEGDPTLLEEFKGIARLVRRALPRHGGRLLVTSAEDQEGRSSVAACLAIALGRRDERVLVIDGQVRGGHESPLEHRRLDEEGRRPGLPEYLSYECADWRETPSPTEYPGVEFIGSRGRMALSDLLASHRMGQLLEEAGDTYSLIVVDGPPVLPFADAELLADQVDAILFVIRANKTPPGEVKRSILKLREAGKPILGVVLNQVHPLYADRD